MNLHQLSSLQLKSYFVSKVSFLVNESYDPQKGILQKSGDFSVTSELVFPPDEKEPCRIRLNVKLQASAESNLPYSLALEMIGFFEQKIPGTKAQVVRKVYTDGTGMLYGVAREVIRFTTSQSPFPPMAIPS